MMSHAGQAGGIVAWAACCRPIPGEEESGDLHVAAEFDHGALLAVIDGLGHGREAAQAARAAAAVLRARPSDPVLDLIGACHKALRNERGAVISLASVAADRGAMTWTGVGNVEAVLTRADPRREPRHERILLRSGVVGYRLPPLRATELQIFPGDLLVMATDGVRHGFAEEPCARATPAEHAERLLAAYGKTSDDSLVLVARYEGDAP